VYGAISAETEGQNNFQLQPEGGALRGFISVQLCKMWKNCTSMHTKMSYFLKRSLLFLLCPVMNT